MKRVLYITVMAMAITVMSCKKFLDATPRDSITVKNYYETEAQLNTALNGVYQVLAQIYGDKFQGLMGLDADEGFHNRSTQTTGIQVNLLTVTETNVSLTWSRLYSGIERANLVLENLNRPAMKEENRNAIKGEALFLRAYFYYVLVTYWGDVPLIIESNKSVTDVHKPRTPAKQVYEQIIKDMIEAEQLVKPITEMTNAGRINKSAVRGILARVCLQVAGEPVKDDSKYQLAKYWAQKVKDDPFHQLNPDYKQVFVNVIQDKYDLKESIWEVEFYGDANDSYNASGRVGINNGIYYTGSNPAWGYCYGYTAVNPMFYYSYAKGDLRRDWVVGRYSLSNAFNPVITYFAALPLKNDASSQTVGKFRREYQLATERNQDGNSTNFPILRYSDVLLMFAEADVQASKAAPSEEAKDAVKAVRARAYGKLLPNKELIDTLVLTRSGTAYAKIPEIRIIGGGGSGAKAIFRSMTSAGAVSDFVITNRGSGYTSAPTVEVGNLWKAQTYYQVGDTVAYQQQLYAVNQAGTSTTTPPTHTSGGVTLGARFLRVGYAVNLTAVITSLSTVPSDALVEQMSTSYNDFMKLIKAERSRELAFEGARKRDLVRWGDYVKAMQQSYLDLQGMSRSWLGRAGQNTTDRDVLWPIPSSETTTNILMSQNKGW